MHKTLILSNPLTHYVHIICLGVYVQFCNEEYNVKENNGSFLVMLILSKPLDIESTVTITIRDELLQNTSGKIRMYSNYNE